jgi:hypothetical protein
MTLTYGRPRRSAHPRGSGSARLGRLTVQFPFGLEPVGQIVAMCAAAREENLEGVVASLAGAIAG